MAPPQLSSLSAVAQTIRQHQVTAAWFAAGLFNRLVGLQLEGLRPLRQLLTGGERRLRELWEGLLQVHH